MESPSRKCQVVVRKINLGERATMHRCVIPIKRLQIAKRTSLKQRRRHRNLSKVQYDKLRVLLQKLNMNAVRVDGSVVIGDSDGEREELEERTLSKIQLRDLRVLLNKLKPNRESDGHSIQEDKENTKDPVKRSCSNLQRHSFRLLLSKIKLNKDGSVMEKKKRDKCTKRTISKVQVHQLKVLLSKLELSSDRRDSSIIVDDHCGIVTCPRSLTTQDKKRFQVLVRRLKLSNILKGLDHTLFIDDKLGMVTNPYLLPSYRRFTARKPPHSILKFRRSRARQCRVRIRKINL